MVVVPIPPQTPKDQHPVLPVTANLLDITWTQGSTDGCTFAVTTNHLLLMWNRHATDPKNVSVLSEPDPQNRPGDITDYALAAGDIAAIRFRSTVGWKDPDTGLVTVDPETSDVWFAVLTV